MRHPYATRGSGKSGDRARWHVLADLAKEYQLKKLVEVGVKAGRLSCELLSITPQDVHLTCVDPWLPFASFPELTKASLAKSEQIFDQIVTWFPGRITKVKLPSVEAAKRYNDGAFDLVFIDANHDYPFVVEDIEAWLPKVRKGGILSGHDYNNTKKYGNRFKGVDRAVDERFAGKFQVEADSVWWLQV